VSMMNCFLARSLLIANVQAAEGNPAIHCNKRIVSGASSTIEDLGETPRTQSRVSDTIKTLARSPDRDSDIRGGSSAISPLKSR
jgi:hypothetical protein